MDNEKLTQIASAIRILAAEAVEKANSGHPGMPMGAADMAAVLWSEFLKFNPQDPEWLGRDRFVLSAGHGSALLYTLLHLFGFSVSKNDLAQFRQWGSITPGHPEYGMTPGVETTTGPLGQGVANGVGLALSSKMLEARYKTDLFKHRVFGIVSDGDLMEGISSEAASLAGHLKLGNLNYLYDDNLISIGGRTDVCFTEDVAKRFEAFGWHVQKVDGHDYEALRNALTIAVAEEDRPSIICARTIIGKGSPKKADSCGVHGSPLGSEELAATKAALGWDFPAFETSKEVSELCAKISEDKKVQADEWSRKWQAWQSSNAAEFAEYQKQAARELSAEGIKELRESLRNIDKGATRNISGKAIQIIAKHMPGFIGGSADLEPSNKTLINDSTDVTAQSFSGKNLRFGVREHAMGAIANGLAYTKEWTPFTATFLVFADYMRPTLRLAALSHIQTLFIFTHDSFWVGEDGPTHQPIEHIEGLRLIPNLAVFRPADGLETAISYELALKRTKAPSALLFTRQDLPVLPRHSSVTEELMLKGAYAVNSVSDPDLLIVATGSEVSLACEVSDELTKGGRKVRVVSMPCVEVFKEQSSDYRSALLPENVPTVVVEAGSTWMWPGLLERQCLCIGKNTFGASAPGELLAEKFGLVPNQVIAKIKAFLK